MKQSSPNNAAYGGAGWSPRTAGLGQELGRIWSSCGIADEWSSLQSVLLHRPGRELEGIADPNLVQMDGPIEPARARRQHDALTAVYTAAGVVVHLVDPPETPPPNNIFVADLMLMTPEGAIVARPASTVRAGEERWVARRLAALGVPIIRTISGQGTFEGADAMWLDPTTLLLATGLRTNREGAGQVAAVVAEMGVTTISVELVAGTMHLMGALRLPDRDLAMVWPGRVPPAAVAALEERGFTVMAVPDQREAEKGMALNFVVLAPRHIVMPAGNPETQAFYESVGLRCETVEVDEIGQAAGSIGCMTGVMERRGS